RIYRARFGDRIPGDDLDLDYRARASGTGLCNHALDLFKALAESEARAGVGDADVLHAVHVFLEHMVVSRLDAKFAQIGVREPVPLCFAGGCALNIKWNRALRNSPHVRELFVPPFPNDSGSAIGMIAADLFREGRGALAWSTYLGPELGADLPSADWSALP